AKSGTGRSSYKLRTTNYLSFRPKNRDGEAVHVEVAAGRGGDLVGGEGADDRAVSPEVVVAEFVENDVSGGRGLAAAGLQAQGQRAEDAAGGVGELALGRATLVEAAHLGDDALNGPVDVLRRHASIDHPEAELLAGL